MNMTSIAKTKSRNFSGELFSIEGVMWIRNYVFVNLFIILFLHFPSRIASLIAGGEKNIVNNMIS